MDVFSIWQQSLAAAWGNLVTRIILFLPAFFGSLLIFTVGILIGNWLEKNVSRFLRLIHFSNLAQTAGLDRFLKKAEIAGDTSSLISLVVKWLVIIMFFMTAANVLGLTAVTAMFNYLMGIIPRVISAALIIGVGLFLANAVDGLVRGALVSVDHAHAKTLGQLARWSVVVISVMAGVSEMKIAQTLVQTFFQGLAWTLTLAIGLSVGLGGKDLVSRLLQDWYDKLKK
jgi:hypothetical protein